MPKLTYYKGIVNNVPIFVTTSFSGFPRARFGDLIAHGTTITGGIVQGVLGVSVNGLLAATVGCQVFCAWHGTQTMVTGATGHFTNGLPSCKLGDLTSCGAVVVTADLFILIT